MHETQRQRTVDLLRAKAIDRALFAHHDSVKWLTGFTPPVELGSNPFAGGPPLVWYEDGRFTLIVQDAHAGETHAFEQESDGGVIVYQAYTIDQPPSGSDNLAGALAQLMAHSGQVSGRVGVETRALPAFLQATAAAALGSRVEMIPIDNWLVPLRAVKTPEELVKLRRNFALTDLGHTVARTSIRPGLREIDVWTEIHSAINREAGVRVPLGNDLVVGYRQANIGGWPLDYEIRADTSVIVDLSTAYLGYWSDSCGTYYAGEMTPKQKTLHRVVRDALDLAISLVRPGVIAREIDQKVRQFIRDAGFPVYPHHTGHGVGVSPHEMPRIVPYNEDRLEAGMVILLEPGIYYPGETGVRLEDAMLITSDGVELLTTHTADG